MLLNHAKKKWGHGVLDKKVLGVSLQLGFSSQQEGLLLSPMHNRIAEVECLSICNQYLVYLFTMV